MPEESAQGGEATANDEKVRLDDAKKMSEKPGVVSISCGSKVTLTSIYNLQQ